jgi:hypothetical protein
MTQRLLALCRRNTSIFLPLSYRNPVVLIKSPFLVLRHLRFAVYDPRYLVWHLQIGNSAGDPFYPSTSELSLLIFALIFSFIWFILRLA